MTTMPPRPERTDREIAAQLRKVHGRGKCHICGKPKAGEGSPTCSYPHGRLPGRPIDPAKPEGFWSWDRPESASAGAGEWQPTHRHYKGGLYRVIARGRIEADLTPCVVYDNAKGETWVRPATDFDGLIPLLSASPEPGEEIKRFTPLPEPPK